MATKNMYPRQQNQSFYGKIPFHIHVKTMSNTKANHSLRQYGATYMHITQRQKKMTKGGGYWTCIPKSGSQIWRGESEEAPSNWTPRRSRVWCSKWRSCTEALLGRTAVTPTSVSCPPLLRRLISSACRASCTTPATTTTKLPTEVAVSAALIEPCSLSLSVLSSVFNSVLVRSFLLARIWNQTGRFELKMIRPDSEMFLASW